MRIGRALVAGGAGAVAYLAAQELDRKVANPRSNDLILLGGMVTRKERCWTPLGMVMHLLAGASFGVIFEAVVAPRLRGPYWLRGILMAQAENASLWPLVLMLDRTHPAVRSGALAPMNTPVYFAQAVWRHLALGAVMGLILGAPDAEAANESEEAGAAPNASGSAWSST
ncbi:MAG: hypothetical protein IT181_11125 [Acidobacteria bacterium]|nr:hypothetical protein [Acidobacteriota bacterium]